MEIWRVREHEEWGELFSLVVVSLSLPQKLACEVDALCVFTGQGEDIRVIQPARNYWENRNTKNRFFLIPGYNEKERTWKKITKEGLAGETFNMNRLGGVHVGPKMHTTKDQSDWAVGKIGELGIKSLGIVSTPFHLIRAYATTLNSLNAAKVRIPVVPVPVYLAPSTVIPETGTGAWDLFQGEAERIRMYRKKGDVISHEKFKEYMDWLWQQPILKDNV